MHAVYVTLPLSEVPGMYSILSVISYHAEESSSGKACSGVVVRPWCVTRGFKEMIVEWSCSSSIAASRDT